MELLNDPQEWCRALNELMSEHGGQPVTVTDMAVTDHEVAGQTVLAVDPGRITVADPGGAGRWVAVYDPDARRWMLEEGI